MPSLKIIGLPVLEKNSFKGFYHIRAWRSSWSCDIDHLYKYSFPFPMEAPHRTEKKKIFETGGRTTTTNNGRPPEHGIL